jgi:hypothetical protein
MKNKDRYLNLFYSYDKGSNKDLLNLKQLENNFTRSFIICFDNLKEANKKLFLEHLISNHSSKKLQLKFKNIEVDLQSFENTSELKEYQKSKSKILLVIGSNKSNIKKDDFTTYNEEMISLFDVVSKNGKITNDLRKFISNKSKEINSKDSINVSHEITEIKKKLKSILNKNQEELNNIFLNINSKSQLETELDLFFDISGKAIPDAWIYNDNFTILIEAKVGSNPIYKDQIFRHLSRDEGFFIKRNQLIKGNKCDKYEIIDITWKDIYNIFKKIPLEKNGKEEFIINQYKEYLKMTAEVLDLSFIVKEDGGYDNEIAKNIFPKLLQELDESIKSSEEIDIENLKRSNRAKSGSLWDYYGIEKNKEVKQDPHYSVYFGEDGAGIELTTKHKKSILKVLENKKLEEFLIDLFKHNTKASISRYSINLGTYKLIDKKKGQIKGETFSTFSFSVNLFELFDQKNPAVEITKILNDMKKYAGMAKQIGILFMVTYPTVSKIKDGSEENTIRSMNKKIFEKNLLLPELIKFIKDTQSIFKDVVS